MQMILLARIKFTTINGNQSSKNQLKQNSYRLFVTACDSAFEGGISAPERGRDLWFNTLGLQALTFFGGLSSGYENFFVQCQLSTISFIALTSTVLYVSMFFMKLELELRSDFRLLSFTFWVIFSIFYGISHWKREMIWRRKNIWDKNLVSRHGSCFVCQPLARIWD